MASQSLYVRVHVCRRAYPWILPQDRNVGTFGGTLCGAVGRGWRNWLGAVALHIGSGCSPLWVLTQTHGDEEQRLGEGDRAFQLLRPGLL